MSQNDNTNSNPPSSPTLPPNSNKYVPWPVRKGIFRSIGQNDFVVPPSNRETSPIVEMPMSPSSARSSPARFIPGYNRSMSPRITIEESPLSPPPQVMTPPVIVYPQSPPPPPPLSLVMSPPISSPLAPVINSSPSPVVREVPIQQERPPLLSEVIESNSDCFMIVCCGSLNLTVSHVVGTVE